MAAVYTGNPCRKYGHTKRYLSNNSCVVCSQITGKNYYTENTEEKIIASKKYYKDNKKKIKIYREDNKERKQKYDSERYWNDPDAARERARESYNPEKARIYRINNKEKVTRASKKHKKENPKLYAYYAAKRRAMLLEQTPPWADMDKIKEIYMTCPEGYEVDHIHPLIKGGLHVDYNLQHLPAIENRVKHAKL
jgi:hypothetical protein